jgi:CO/xanthine dehydrogenase FAD-binding subunit
VSQPGITEYIRPDELETAWERIEAGGATIRVLSGGTDLTISAPPEVTTLVDVAGCLDHDIEVQDDGWVRTGAMATLTAMLDDPYLAGYASGVVPEMMADVGNPLLRNISTIGGHLARGKLSDVIPVMVALDAEIAIYDGESRRLPLARYYEEGLHKTPHLVTDLLLPPLAQGTEAAFLRFARTSFDFPMLNVCCRAALAGPLVTDVRIVCGATPLRAQRGDGAEAWIREHGLNSRSIETAAKRAREEIVTKDGWVASSDYRKHLVEVLTERCLTEVARRLGVS